MTFLDLFSVYLGDKHAPTSALMFVDPVLGCVSQGKMLGCAFPCSNRDQVTNPLWGRRVSCSEPRDSCVQEASLLTISRDASLEGRVSLCLENSALRFRATGLRGGAADPSACAGTRALSSCSPKRARSHCSFILLQLALPRRARKAVLPWQCQPGLLSSVLLRWNIAAVPRGNGCRRRSESRREFLS